MSFSKLAFFAALALPGSALASVTGVTNNTGDVSPVGGNSLILTTTDWGAVAFTTGPSDTLLAGIEVGGNGFAPDPVFQVYTDAASQPGVMIEQLTSGTSWLASWAPRTFTSVDFPVLTGNTTYWIVGAGYGTYQEWSATTDTNETGEPGWTIADGRLVSTDSGASWSPAAGPFFVDIKLVDVNLDGVPDGPPVDGDGICDPSDVLDGDLDGVADDCDACPAEDATGYDVDSDGCVDDTDSDGLLDPDELGMGTDPFNPDSDGDGLSDGDEFTLGTDPLSTDSDGDTVPDGNEVSLTTDPNNPDSDGDGLGDGFELGISTNPIDTDTDDDGLDDGTEVSLGTGPTIPDSDGDALTDGIEQGLGTDPLNPDSDGDGMTDGAEDSVGTDPNNPDSDGDGALDGAEITAGTNPNNPDSDGDSVLDGVDLCPGANDLLNSDGDLFPDCQDLCPAEDATGFDLDLDGCLDDSDADTVTDDLDACPGADDLLNSDGDVIPDCLDLCPAEDATGFDLDLDGCLDDSDGDGVPDGIDACPGADDLLNSDGDVIPDCLDLCPVDDATGFDLDLDGCLDVADGDGDGVPDELDACPAEDASGQDADSNGCIDAGGGAASHTFVTNTTGVARDSFQTCSNDTGSWVCTEVQMPAWAGQLYGLTFTAFDADQDGLVGFIATGPANLQCEPNPILGWTCAELLPSPATHRGQIWDVGTADVNADDVPDVVFASHVLGTGHCLGGTSPMTCDFDGVISGPNHDTLDYADYNNDGVLDVFAAYYLPYNTGSSKLCLGDGLGGYACQPINDIPTSPRSVITDVSHLDANLDGLPDVFVENNAGGAGEAGELCLNNAGSPGTFTCATPPFPNITYQGSPWGYASNDQVVADMDNDGDEDLVFGSRGDPFACWSDGAGALTCNLLDGAPTSSIEAGAAMDVEVGDVDGDGWKDVIAVMGENVSGVRQCLNQQDHTFACTDIMPGMRLSSVAFVNSAPVFGPYDGDGICDPGDTFDTDADDVPDDCDLCPVDNALAADADGDGCLDDTDADGVTDDRDACPASDATGFDADGDGCLDDTDADGVTDDADACPAEDASASDADGDGCLDAGAPAGGATFVTNVASVGRDRFRTCNNGSGAWVCTDVVMADRAGTLFDLNFMAFDANQDGLVGFITTGNANLQCEPDAGAASGWTCADLVANVAGERGQIWDVATADLNGDAAPDLVFASHITGTGRCLGGTFPMSCDFDGVISGPNHDTLDYADYNNDGVLDVFAAYYLPYNTGSSKLCLGDGLGGYACQPINDITTSPRSVITDVNHLDANLDGLADVFVENNAGGAGEAGELCLNNPGAPGTFTCATPPFPIVTYQGSPWGYASNDQVVADLDNDGDEDLAFGSRGDPFACWSDGAGALTCNLLDGAPSSSIEAGAAVDVDVADLDGDGWKDVIAVMGENATGVRQCLNQGDHTFACTDILPGARVWSAAVLTVASATPPADGDGVCQPSDAVDGDSDGVADDCDACPAQGALGTDSDGDGCLDDADGDTVIDELDQCPDEDDLQDPDGDAVFACLDACPTVSSAGFDADSDGCLDDSDGDTLTDDVDACPGEDDLADPDFDGVRGCLDLCPGSNAAALDTDRDGCLDDSDGDSVTDDGDACPGEDDLADPDGDGVLGCLDLCPDVSSAIADLDGDGCVDGGDDDSDGIPNDTDLCFGANNTLDADEDGVCGDQDLCEGDDASGDEDLDGYCAEPTAVTTSDCDDSDDATFPGAEEACDGADNNCDGELANTEYDLNNNGIPDCTCTSLPCKRGEFRDDQGSLVCATGSSGAGWWAIVALAGLVRRRR